MVKYIFKRLLISLITLFIIVFALFVLVRLVPGNPFPSEKLTQEQIEQKREEMGLNDPILVQFGRYIGNLCQGDLGKGTSLYNGAPIKTVIWPCLLNSLKIGFVSVIIGIGGGLLIGILGAFKKKSFFSVFCNIICIVGICLPSYVFFIYIQRFFAFDLKILPVFFDSSYFLKSSIIPGLSISLFSMATMAKFASTEIRKVMESDYIKLIEAKGIYGPRIIFNHVLRNSMISIITVMGPLIVGLLTGATVVEKLYGINGIGRLMVDAISGSSVDYNYILILGIIYSSLYILVMLVIDLLYGVIDPRASVTGSGKVE